MGRELAPQYMDEPVSILEHSINDLDLLRSVVLRGGGVFRRVPLLALHHHRPIFAAVGICGKRGFQRRFQRSIPEVRRHSSYLAHSSLVAQCYGLLQGWLYPDQTYRPAMMQEVLQVVVDC